MDLKKVVMIILMSQMKNKSNNLKALGMILTTNLILKKSQ
jgi:hypothetical protein